MSDTQLEKDLYYLQKKQEPYSQDDVVNMISEALEAQRAEIAREVEGMKRTLDSKDQHAYVRHLFKNDALDDVLALLREEK